MVETLGLLDPTVAALFCGMVVVLLGILRYGYDLPVLFGALVVPPVAGLCLVVAVVLRMQFDLRLLQALGVVGGVLVGLVLGYLLIPYAGRAVSTLGSGGRKAVSLMLTVVVPWRLAYWLRIRLTDS